MTPYQMTLIRGRIFTENRTTQDFLFQLLDGGPYKGKVLVYNGSRTRDDGIMERFEKEAKILIATDVAAEGFNLEFCSFVINYDLPYNTLTIEQRINRCHRQGQQSDVIILHFLNKNNFADVRLLQLINKRILQFSGVFGLSDDVLGHFGVDLGQDFSRILGKARSREEIDRAYNDALVRFERENKQALQQAEHALFSSFTPYNTGHDFVYEDDFADTLARYKEVTSQTTKSNPESMGRFHTNWLK